MFRRMQHTTGMRLAGKVAIITGAAGGIGGAAARCFVAEGARVVLSDRDEQGLAAVAEPLGAAAVAIAGDVADPTTAARAVAAAQDRFGALHVVFANAGMEGQVAPLVQQHSEDVERLLRVNVLGVFHFIAHATPLLTASGVGSIVITSSVAGVLGYAGLGPYVASKHAVIGLMRTAAIELASANIRVNTVNPGPIDNRMMRSIAEQSAPAGGEAVRAALEHDVPLARYGTNEEVARLALFLASDESSYCTGSVFMVDGGFAAR
jgi:NAD(P)-dependent dehydrogenase (short-subunit alcohol dehydrogenase family)